MNKKNYCQQISFIKQICCFIIGLFVLQLISIIVTSIFSTILVSNGLSNEEIQARFLGREGMIINAIVYLITFLIFVFTLNRDIKVIFNSSFNKAKNYFAGIICLLVMIALTKFYSSIISPYLSSFENSNQTAIVAYTEAFPLLAFITFVIFGPICEEFTYRLGLYSLIRRKGKYLAIILSSLIFAFIHFDFTTIMSGDISLFINELLIIPSYIISGICLAFIYEKYGLAASLTTHILNNFIAILEIMF